MLPTPAPWSAMDLLPGLLVLLVTMLLARWLRRLGDPIPWPVWATLTTVLLLLCGPALLGGRVLLPIDGLRGEAPFQGLAASDRPGNPLHGDQLQLLAPADQAVRQALRRAEWPLWNPGVGAGIPLLGDPQGQAFSPLALVARLLPPFPAAAALAALRVVVSFVFFFCLLVRYGSASGPAAVGALGWSLGGAVQLWLGWPLASAAALLPATLHAVAVLDADADAADPARAREGEERKRGRGALPFLHAVAVTAALLLSGHPEAIALCLGLVVLEIGRRGLARAGGRRPLLPLLARCGLALALAATVAAPVLLPTLHALRASERAAFLHPGPGADVGAGPANIDAGTDLSVAGGLAVASERTGIRASRRWSWLPWVAPQVFGNDRYADGVHRAYWGPRNVQEDALGFAGSFLLLLALLPGAGRSGQIAHRPEPGRTRGDPRAQRRFWRAVLLLCLVAAAAGPASGVRVGLIFGFALSVLGTLQLHLWTNGWTNGWTNPEAHGEEPDRGRGRDLGSAARIGIFTLLVALAIVAAYQLFPSPEDPSTLAVLRQGFLKLQVKILVLGAVWCVFAALHSRRRAWVTAGFLVAAELLVAHVPMNPSAERRRSLPHNAALEILQGRAGEGRIAALGDALPPNQAALWGLEDARAYNPMTPAPYRAWMAPLLENPGAASPRLAATAAVATDPRLDRAAVRFLLLAPTAGSGAQDQDPLRRALEAGSLRPVYDGPEARIVERRDAGPWLEVSARTAFAGRAPRRLSRQAAHWRADLPVTLETEPAPDRSTGAATLRAALFQDGGWTALADGVARPTRADPLLTAGVPPATTRIDLVYRPRGFLLGMLLGSIGLAAGTAGLLFPAARPDPRPVI